MSIIVFAILLIAIPYFIARHNDRIEQEKEYQRDDDLHTIANYIRSLEDTDKPPKE